MLRRVLMQGLSRANRLSGGRLGEQLGDVIPGLRPDGPVDIVIAGARGRVPAGTTVLDACRRLGVELEHCCGGESTCGTCRVTILEGGKNLSRVHPREGGTLEGVMEGPNDRLGCQARIHGPVKIEVPDDWRGI